MCLQSRGTALHDAVYSDKVACVRVLIAHGADPRLKNKYVLPWWAAGVHMEA